MDRSPALAMAPGGRADRIAERVLRRAADGRVGVGLLIVAGAWNALAAALPGGPALLDSAAYSLLLGAILFASLAAFATRVPAAWREWRRPGSVLQGRSGAARLEWSLEQPFDEGAHQRLVTILRRAGYRVAEDRSAGRWAVHGTKFGWSRLAALASHVAVALLLVGAAAGIAFGSETTFSLLPGEQAVLDTRPGAADAMRLDAFDAEFGADGRPRRLDTTVSFLRGGEAVESAVLQVNRPGSFGEQTVHAWTYGPAVRLRVTTLAERPLLDAALPLDDEREGFAAAIADLPAADARLGIVLLDADANEVAITVARPGGVQDAARLVPGEERRVGDLLVRLDGFDAYVTFLARRDPGGPLLVAGAAALTASLAIAFWLPRRRLTLTADGGLLRLVVRGERFDDPTAEADRLRRRLAP